MNQSHLTDFQILGQTGEQLAADYLISHGYYIIERNWVCGRYEVDIICLNNFKVVFVEVKSHSLNPFFDIRLMVNKEKQRKIICSANRYIKMHHINYDAQFDIVEVLIKGNDVYEINHIPNAFHI